MKRILLPTDFSENSWNAIKYALQLFKDSECNFTLLNTYTPMIYQFEYTLESSVGAELVDAMRETSVSKLDEMVDRIEKEFKNPKHIFGKTSSFNTLLREIDELYEGNTMDLIVMGTKGATGAKEILFGSNTVHVFKNAKCPVIAVPSGFEFEEPHEILFPSDYEVDFEDKHVALIKEIGSAYHARVNIMNVSYGYDLSEDQEKNRKKLEGYFKGIAHLFHNVSNQTVAGAITEFQLKARVNLLTMINNKHSFFENLFFKSTINQIGFHLAIPFLVIPTK
ncbi:MAG: universal stress protein [Flavobacteriaceae bacterium]|nr:MAG: universal stress protein [Flavobacteriaceae bacterium]RZW41210.1 MAG: universal stress protein [Flavobacteriaceae bacterium]